MDIYWLEQTEADPPADNSWLNGTELALMSALRVPKRRADWRLGRWTAKQAFAACSNAPIPLSDIEVRPNASGAPELLVAGQPADASISITHCSGTAACAIAASGVMLGCDMERIEPRSDAFVSDYFTDTERELIEQAPAAQRELVITLLWSAKESALKAVQEGLRLDTRLVVVHMAYPISYAEGRWHPLTVDYVGEQVFRGWWSHSTGLIRTVVADPSPAKPIQLNAALLHAFNSRYGERTLRWVM